MIATIGEKYGKLTILEDLGMLPQNSGKKRRFVRCKCDCGKIKDINWYDLKSGKIISCGCFHKELVSDLGKKKGNGNPKHLLYGTTIYKRYHQIKGECYNKNNPKYRFFGGRGIFICKNWLDENNGFLNFYNWSLKNGFDEEKAYTSLCRKDLNKEFSPENCFWNTLSYNRKHCLSSESLLSQTKKVENWRKENEDIFLEAIHKGLKTKVIKYGKIATNRENCSWKQGWREIGGKRKYFRSKWEANYARYLEFLKVHSLIKEWQHESKTFWFDKIKRGCCSYLPDFEITNNDGSVEFHEVKGWYDERSKTKIKRMAKYYPNVKLVVIFGKQYNAIAKKMKGLIPSWE